MLACLNGRGRMVVCGLAKLFIEFQLGATSSFFVLVDLYVKTAERNMGNLLVRNSFLH